MEFPPTREAGLARLGAFLPHASNYASDRNYDRGPEDRSNVSGLSPYLRTRLLTEEEVCRAALASFEPPRVDKFLQEVAWRSYWKGWLEMRPEAWERYRRERDSVTPPPEYAAAVNGKTGIACFDQWARELVRHGYLHNHARMWLASIWIFTLRLPWQLGADFFLQHLLDGDPASNTLSWRWVAGLHTRGKHYLARAANIAKYTDGRFDPAGQLDETAAPLPSDGSFALRPLDLPAESLPPGRLGHLMIPDDLAPPEFAAAATAGWCPGNPDELGRPTAKVAGFLSGAVDDALRRASGERLRGDLSRAAGAWANRHRLDAVVIMRPTVGPWRDLLRGFDPGVPVHFRVRTWDRSLWPHATAGFFKLRKRLPALFSELIGSPAPDRHRPAK